MILRDGVRRFAGRVLLAATALGSVLSVGLVTPVSSLAAGPAYLVSRIPIGLQPIEVASDPATDMVYLGAEGRLVVVSGASGAVTATFDLSVLVEGIAVDSATDTIYVSTYSPTTRLGRIEVVDGATNAVTSTIAEPAGDYPAGVAVNEATDTVYVANRLGSNVAVIDGATSSLVASISTGQGTHPVAVAADPKSSTTWVAGDDGQIWTVSAAGDSIVQTTTLASGLDALAVNTSTDTVYAASPQLGEVSVIDGATGTVTATIGSIAGATGLTVDPSSGLVYAAALKSGLGTTSVIDGSTNAIVGTIPRGGTGAAADSATGSVYVAGGTGPGDMWVLTPAASTSMSPVVTSSDNTDFFTGQAGSYQVQASAIPAATYTEAGPLPGGVVLKPDGSLAGTPVAGSGGQYPIIITASNGVGPSYPQRFFLTVYQAPVITTAPHARFVGGKVNTFALQATGYPLPTFSETGKLPPLTSIIATSGGWALAGSPPAKAGGTYRFTLIASGVGPPASQAFTLTVTAEPAFVSASRATFKPGAWNRFTVRTTGFPRAKLSERGKLPTGITFRARSNGTAVLSGRARRADVGKRFKITLLASNGVGRTARQTFTLKIS